MYQYRLKVMEQNKNTTEKLRIWREKNTKY